MISYHILIDNVNNSQLSELNSHLIRLQPKYVNIMGGSRFEQALQYAETVTNLCPNTRIILRKWPDDGILKRYNYDMDKWYSEVIKPYEWWLKGRKNIIWLLDNESMSNDLTQYAIASAQAMHKCAKIGLGLAVGRFATGNPAEHQYSQLDTMWITLKSYNGLHIFSPNEYFDKPLTGYGVGSIGRYKLAWNRCLEKYNFTPETVIGEFGLAVNYDPHKGWRTTSLSENDYASLCLEYDKGYTYNNITACVFSVGSWNGFDVSKTFYDTIETRISDWNKPIEIKSKIHAICYENGVRIRETPINGRTLGYASFASKFEVLGGTPGKQEWLKINYKGAIAYTAGWFYVPCSCDDNFTSFETGENTMSLPDWMTNRTIMTPILTALIQFIFLVLLNIFQINLPFTQEQLAGFMIGAWFFLVTLISGGNVLYDNNNVKAGNVWDKSTRNWVKPD